MKYLNLNRITKLYFGYEEIARALGIGLSSARVSANRYVRSGFLLRLKRNIYVTRERWNALSPEEQFVLANLGQTPSYISLMTALSYYGISTQLQRDYLESVAVKRTRALNAGQMTFRYAKIRPDLYFGFERVRNFFIANPEKAFLDAVYLTTLGRYRFDKAALDFAKLNSKNLSRLSLRFPVNVQQYLRQNEYLK